MQRKTRINEQVSDINLDEERKLRTILSIRTIAFRRYLGICTLRVLGRLDDQRLICISNATPGDLSIVFEMLAAAPLENN